MDFWPFVRALRREVREYACQAYSDGWAEVEQLKKLSQEGTSEEKTRAADQLVKLGVPGVWFHRRFTERYPTFTREQRRMLFQTPLRRTARRRDHDARAFPMTPGACTPTGWDESPRMPLAGNQSPCGRRRSR